MLPATTESVLETHADVEHRLAALLPLAVPVPEAADHRDRSPERAILVVLLRDRQAEDRHDRVADELVEQPALLRDAVDHAREVVVEQRHGWVRSELLRQRREAADVGEEDCRNRLVPA